ncbi:unnamed protein product [Caretta caretta]
MRGHGWRVNPPLWEASPRPLPRSSPFILPPSQETGAHTHPMWAGQVAQPEHSQPLSAGQVAWSQRQADRWAAWCGPSPNWPAPSAYWPQQGGRELEAGDLGVEHELFGEAQPSPVYGTCRPC